eukprot:TRINITY_DN24829_c0_g2_i1.p1 TRINITY_DN24829_c0_g2~~TRINITY_DN24829_c0_g2_i1.p1  ORF type:complete len:519 (-),score=77.19 TRINITY_DN24829_c0_g2_i1:454-1962(-)
MVRRECGAHGAYHTSRTVHVCRCGACLRQRKEVLLNSSSDAKLKARLLFKPGFCVRHQRRATAEREEASDLDGTAQQLRRRRSSRKARYTEKVAQVKDEVRELTSLDSVGFDVNYEQDSEDENHISDKLAPEVEDVSTEASSTAAEQVDQDFDPYPIVAASRWRRTSRKDPLQWIESLLSDACVFDALCDRLVSEFDKDNSGAIELREAKLLARTLYENSGIYFDASVISEVEADFATADNPKANALVGKSFHIFLKMVLERCMAVLKNIAWEKSARTEEIEVSVAMITGTEVGLFQVVWGSPIHLLLGELKQHIATPPLPNHKWALLCGEVELKPSWTFFDAKVPDGAVLTLIQKMAWPSLRASELQFKVERPFDYGSGDAVRSPAIKAEPFSFCLLVFPGGNGKSKGTHVSAYVEVQPEPGDTREEFPNVFFEIKVMNRSKPAGSIVKSDTFKFTSTGCARDRGWHGLLPLSDLKESPEWVDADGTLTLRAFCMWATKDK